MKKFSRLRARTFALLLASLCSVAYADTTRTENSARADDTARTRVFVLSIRAEIDPRTSRYVELGLEEATRQRADYVLVDLDTYGGAVNDADKIRTMLLEYPRPVWVHINKNAASAGALISIACDSIYMTGGANIGAATVVQGGTGEAAPDKYQSYFRSMMRSTAEANGRDPRIAEAMVDQDIEIEGISPAGEVITFTTAEAIKYGFCEARVATLEGVLERNGITDYDLIRYELSVTERIIALVLNPFVSGILILLILGGLYFELQTPGVGFPLIISVTAAILYFIPYYLNGLAANWEVLLVFVGIGLIAAEVFVFPGFGVAGIAGLAFTLGGLLLMMLDNELFDFRFVPAASLFEATLSVAIGLFGFIGLVLFGGLRLTESKRFKRMTLQTTMGREQGYSSFLPTRSMVGQVGTAYTVLRPSGKVLIGDTLYEGSSLGDYIDRGEPVIVVEADMSSLSVRRYQAEATASDVGIGQ